jgi:hypothetical protein
MTRAHDGMNTPTARMLSVPDVPNTYAGCLRTETLAELEIEDVGFPAGAMELCVAVHPLLACYDMSRLLLVLLQLANYSDN